MATLLQNFRQTWTARRGRATPAPAEPALALPRPAALAVDLAPNDPLLAYFLTAPGAVELDRLHLDSPGLRALRAAGVQISVPLISHGELVGLLHLGPRRSEQDYSSEDRSLLTNLAAQAAPAVRVAQLVRAQQAEARKRERIEQELRVARLIQQTLLPKELPTLPGWQVAAYYQPARAVGGDFYDFVALADGRLGLLITDVTDKGVPAALVMATTRAMLRAAAVSTASPGTVLGQVNDRLCPDIPPKMFVTCLYAILDPATGRLEYANAGHDLPYHRHAGGVAELRARGMPLGLMPGMEYEERETTLAPGDSLLFYTDGIVEAHNARREMFSFPRLQQLLAADRAGRPVIEFLLDQLTAFTGADWEQEDDVTMVALERSGGAGGAMMTLASPTGASAPVPDGAERVLAAWSVPSAPGNERQAAEQVTQVVRDAGALWAFTPRRLERLKTAVAEAVMNAIEHGNQYQPDQPVAIQVAVTSTTLLVRITDQGGAPALSEPAAPDLEAKLAETQTPRGWGLFLIKHLVDEMRVSSDASTHTVELVLRLEGEPTDAR
jgi:serine phosphatase RsbU (regulator of sigma subunit)/anti-sigma regulatory factor (Ser/Thr protein kinase)